MAWLTGWSYRKEITITGQSGAGTNYQVKFDVGDSAGGDFHLEGNCTNFPQDIEVTDNDETTLLDYWIEDITADPLKMWIEVADDLGSNQTIYIYYGKSGATTNSDIEATMIFGDDFNDGSLDLTTRWSWVGTDTKTEASGYLQVTTGVEPDSMLYSQSTFTRPYILEFDVELDGERSLFGVRENSGTIDTDYTRWKHSFHHSSDVGSGKRLFTLENNAFTDSTTFWTINTKYRYRIEIHSTGADYYSNDALVRDGTAGTTDPTKIGFVGYSSNVYKLYDVFIRKYNANEPAFSSAGSEETPPTGVSPTAVFYGPLVGPLGGPI